MREEVLKACDVWLEDDVGPRMTQTLRPCLHPMGNATEFCNAEWARRRQVSFHERRWSTLAICARMNSREVAILGRHDQLGYWLRLHIFLFLQVEIDTLAVGVTPLPEARPQVEVAVAGRGGEGPRGDCWRKDDKKRCAR